MNYSGPCKLEASAMGGTLPQDTPAAVEVAPRAPDGAPENVLDFEKLQILDDIMPREEANAFVNLYLTDVDVHLAAVADAAKQMDLNAIARSAHVLVSTAGNVGAAAVSLSARRLVDACRKGAPIAAGIEELQTASRAASAALRAWLAARTVAMPVAERA
jgi:HPt (histidine-containing phosphotransfer) domain-containing protein